MPLLASYNKILLNHIDDGGEMKEFSIMHIDRSHVHFAYSLAVCYTTDNR